MNEVEALQIVLDLAVQNMADENDHPKEYARQEKAILIVQSMTEDRG